ncbi:MAG: helix-turn-helix domain-containing protein [Acidimicrobiales bacterium]
MGNERLRRAMAKKGVSQEDLAAKLGVSKNSVTNWIAGTVPYPRNQAEIAAELDEDVLWLFPEGNVGNEAAREELVRMWARRSDCPSDYWWDLIVKAERQVDVLGYAVLFLTENHPDLAKVLAEFMRNGGVTRFVIADPHGDAALYRDGEEGLDGLLLARIQSSLKYLGPSVDAGASLYFQNAPMYSSVFRFDDDMMVTPHLFRIPGKEAPLFHFRRLGTGGIFDQYVTHFEGVLARATPQSRNAVTALKKSLRREETLENQSVTKERP